MQYKVANGTCKINFIAHSILYANDLALTGSVINVINVPMTQVSAYNPEGRGGEGREGRGEREN